MRVPFTKMQGAGNDFVVLDETRALLGLSRAQYRWLADRHFGVGADQILSVRPAPEPDVDFAYAIHNADGQEVEHCGNGARCFLNFVHERGLSAKPRVRVRTMNRVLELSRNDRGEVLVDMGAPRLELDQIPYVPQCPFPKQMGQAQQWILAVVPPGGGEQILYATLVSMGNPHAVLLVDDVEATDVAMLGPAVQALSSFPQGVNVGFMQVVDRSAIRLRVYERGAGETLACGTGACAAAVAGMQLGLLEPDVSVQTRGGPLRVHWEGGASPVQLAGPATTVFIGEIEIPEQP